MRFVFAPIGIIAGLLAGMAAQKGFERIWRVVDDREPPDAKDREIQLPKLVLALLVEGAIFRLVKGLVDRGTRSGFARVTGEWPGEQQPEAE